jgi:hypothetical protein
MNRRQRRALFLVGLIMGVLVAPALGAAAGTLVSSVFPIASSGTISYETNSGVVVNYDAGGADLGADPFVDDETVAIRSSEGNITVSGSGTSAVTVEDATGEWTNTSLSDVKLDPVTFDPEDKAKLSVNGETTQLDWRDYAVDNGQADVVYAGASAATTTLTLYNLPANRDIGVVDVNSNEVLANASTDGSGTMTVTLPNSQHTVSLQTGVDPDISNPDPDRTVSTTQPQSLNVSLSDEDFPQDTVNATFYVKGDKVGTDTLTSNGTAEVDVSGYSNWTLGENRWWVVANDSYNNSVRSSNFSVGIPNELTIRNETRPSEIVNNTQVEVAFFNGSQVINRTTSDGIVNMSGLPADQRYIVTADADTYHPRTVVVDDIAEQGNIYLLNDSLGVEIRFELDDRTGNFPSDSVLFVEKPIELNNTTTYRTVVADRFGPNGVTTFLEEDERHQLRIRNPDQDVRLLGAFTPSVAETVVLEIGDIEVRSQADGSTYRWDARYTEDSNGNAEIEFDFDDGENATDNLDVQIYERNNQSNTILDTTIQGPVGEVAVTQPLTSAQQNTTWVVEWDANRGGESISGRRVVGDTVQLGVPIDSLWKNTASVALVVIVGGAMGGISAPLGAAAVAMVGGLLWFVGWLPTGIGGGAVALALLVAVAFGLWRRR